MCLGIMRSINCLIKVSFSLLLMFSCSCTDQRNTDYSVKPSKKSALVDSIVVVDNVTTTFSSDMNKLSKLLDFKKYKPEKVKFRYTFIDNSGGRTSVPGPSDYSLQAVLYFDSLTFEEFHEFDRSADYPSPNFDKEEFKFDWLNKSILSEIDHSQENYHGHPDFFFGTRNGKCWYLDRKILISYFTN